MLVHQAFDKMLKHCGIAAKDLATVTGISNSRISQFRNGTFLGGKGSDLTSRSLDELLQGAEKLHPDAGMVFSLLLMDKDPSLVDDSLNQVVTQSNWRSMIRAVTDKEAQEITLALAEKYSNSTTHNTFNRRPGMILSSA
jgi:DNA-binding Xre family transcriptional regulator